MSELQKTHTPCKNCVFAEYAGKVQVGCGLGRIDPYRAQDNVIDAEDGDKQFFIINGRYCNAYNEADSAFAKKFKPEDRVGAMQKLLQLRLTVLVMIENEKDFYSLESTCQSLLAQSLRPFQVLFVSNQNVIKPPDLQSRLYKEIGNAFTWRILQIFEKMPDGSRVNQWRAIDHALSSITGVFYSVLKAGLVLPPSFIKDIDEALNTRLERFSLLLPVNETGLTVQTAIHKHPAINIGYASQGPTIVDLIKSYAEVEEKSFMVRQASEICPSLL